MTSETFSALLLDINACEEAQTWATGKTLAEVWAQCGRGDWMLWLCGRLVGRAGWPTHKEVVLAACACAELSLKYVPTGEDRPRQCLEVVRAWAAGNATLEDVRKARDAAYAAAYARAAAAYAAAAYAAASAAYYAASYAAAYAAASASASASAAASAAYYAAADVADAAYSAYARSASLKESANICRAMLKVPV